MKKGTHLLKYLWAASLAGMGLFFCGLLQAQQTSDNGAGGGWRLIIVIVFH
jgi:hypothetical protein